MQNTDYKSTVKHLLTTIYDHELNSVPDDIDRKSVNWTNYLQNVLKVPRENLLELYTRALDYRNQNKVSSKFRIQDMQAAWTEWSNSDNYKKIVPTAICALCNNTGRYKYYDTALTREVEIACKH